MLQIQIKAKVEDDGKTVSFGVFNNLTSVYHAREFASPNGVTTVKILDAWENESGANRTMTTIVDMLLEKIYLFLTEMKSQLEGELDE